MNKVNIKQVINELRNAKANFLSVVAICEDSKLNPEDTSEIISIIEETQIQSVIALEEISN